MGKAINIRNTSDSGFLRNLLLFFLLSVEMLPNGCVPLKLVKLLFVLLTARVVWRQRAIQLNRYLVWLAGICLLTAASVFWADSRQYALNGLQTVLLNSLCILSMVQLIFAVPNWEKIVYSGLAIGPGLRFAYLFLNNGFAVFRGLRSLGTGAGSYNSAGMLAGLGVSFAFLGLMQEKDAKQQRRWRRLIVLNLVIMVLSMSRKALGYLVIPILLYHLFKDKNTMKRLRNLALTLAACVLLYNAVMHIPLLYHYIGQGLESLLGFLADTGRDTSAAGRETRALWGLYWFEQQPVLGHGVMNYNYLFQQAEPWSAMIVADNNYIELLVNYGVVGLVVYYSLFVRAALFALRNRKRLISEEIVITGILLALAVGDYGSSSYLYLHSQMLLALTVILLYRRSSRNPVHRIRCGRPEREYPYEFIQKNPEQSDQAGF